MTFDDLGLSPNLLAAIKDAGYTAPTPIQAGAIPVALTGRDVLGIAQTGTGKTASFTLPLIERLSRGRARARMPRSLILCPTRELADQVAQNVRLYAKNHKLTMALLIGGVAFQPQKEILDKGADILIATPGRLLDHFERGGLMLMGIEIMIVDEADRMLDMGFIPDIERIFSLVPPRRQTLFFSATMPNEIVRIVNTFLKDPERIEVSRPAQTAETIKQYIVRVADGSPAGKRAALRAAINRDGVKNGIVFCNRKRDVDIVARSLQRHGFSAAPIHGDLAQAQRMKTLADFKSDQVRILVASDVAARGLDIPAVSHVFNFDIPRNADDYVHRIGRTGRAGLTGESITLVTGDDKKSLANVVKLIGSEPETLALDGAATPAAAPARTDDAEGEVKAARSRRGGRSRTRPATDKPDDQAAAKAPADAPAPTPANDAQKGKRAKPASKDAGVEAAGFGDHVPEFLLRSALG
ncbi:DEAD/DEAH box helicase domain-containing protein [Glycocaulis alkaliphilus]|uniref:DEAD-box ATP-dependent RNA helicase RhpA n=1 Tax=Glycocaulis alkaliphilus TaxID=1434191 RepID=A0A3T0EA30_9PROT|nr:DEAD/DEAH box helicase domain-containing protein [Glycocaulis alkaliphilus]GGB76984.1 DEAD/DEAH box helicase [Glycocaulis alkaliphilus]